MAATSGEPGRGLSLRSELKEHVWLAYTAVLHVGKPSHNSMQAARSLMSSYVEAAAPTMSLPQCTKYSYPHESVKLPTKPAPLYTPEQFAGKEFGMGVPEHLDLGTEEERLYGEAVRVGIGGLTV
jgi:hypothetical protein